MGDDAPEAVSAPGRARESTSPHAGDLAGSIRRIRVPLDGHPPSEAILSVVESLAGLAEALRERGLTRQGSDSSWPARSPWWARG